jgi:hypothetical protein
MAGLKKEVLELREVSSKKEFKEFIYLPKKLHKNHENWVPPLFRDEWNYVNQRKNLALEYCDTLLILAYQNGEAVGRIMGIINHRNNDYKKCLDARFSHLESIDDISVIRGLLEYVEKWAKTKNMERIIGPMGLTYTDPMGFQIDGFDYPPSVAANYNFEYLPKRVEESGYITDEDLVVYKIPVLENLPSFYERIHNRVKERSNFKLISFKNRRDIKKAIIPVLRLMNTCFEEIYGYSELTDREMINLAKAYLPILKPSYIKVAENDKELVGFMISMPHLSEGFKAANGRLFPFGFLRILSAMKNSRRLDLLIGGIRREYRSQGVDVLIAYDMMITAKKMGYSYIDSHLELAANVKVTGEMAKMGGEIYKKYRIFQKQLTD